MLSPTSSKARTFSGSAQAIRLMTTFFLVSVSILCSAQPNPAFAAACSDRASVAQQYSAIEADFYACVVGGLTGGSAIEPVEDDCAIKYRVATSVHEIANGDSTQAPQLNDHPWWIEY